MASVSTSEHLREGNLDTSDRGIQPKRRKLDHDGSSAPSNTSDDSALLPTSVPDESTDASDADSDVSSELSESSEEPSDEDSDEDSDGSESDGSIQDDEAAVVNLRANRGVKPVMKLADDDFGEDIRPFLKDFLPKLRAANEELEAQKKAGTLETAEVEEEGKEQYIEMNLGLGVLKAKTADASDSSDSESDDEDGQSEEKDIMGKLMGREKTKAVPGVQELDEKDLT